MVAVIPFVAEVHLEETVQVLMRVRQADPTYPPQADVDVDETAESFSSWLMEAPALSRWVAIVDGHVAGHVMVGGAHDYLITHLRSFGFRSKGSKGIVEVGKVFVDPLRQRLGIGASLLATARSFSWARGLQPCLAVVVTSYDAIRLYQREGLIIQGRFFGLHGENLVLADEGVGSK